MGCTSVNKEHVYVLIETELGDIKIKLYNETPLHRDNFVKLVKEGYYNDLLFHRVIKDFMIQGGDPDSKGAAADKTLGSGGPGYTLPAEIVYPLYFHKKGVLAAARQGDEVNPKKESSGSQFYIVTGNVYSEGKLKNLEQQLTQMKERNIFNRLVGEHRSEIMQLRKNRDQEGLMALQDTLVAQTHEILMDEGPVMFTPEQKEAYTSMGGAPHLDGEYTVFGEVVEGLDVVDKIQSVATGRADRPKKDISMRMKIIE
ncbi:peptidylprolyl isomerase [uncultured Coprobacter sp.]|uniref:peptidylprolyl isomerase n=1 Tax=uncultured Coprobacter sp. TaxID=1720550 RepID=UPI0026095351|nr:peptidylprolyl isomerase [uncultured Coprobacter sp.]